jgi:hypothetical protein
LQLAHAIKLGDAFEKLRKYFDAISRWDDDRQLR